MQIILFILTFLVGFLCFKAYTYFYNRFPKLKIKRLELFPSIRIVVRGKIIHVHHWFYFLIIISVSVFIGEGLLTTTALRGIITGGFAQGMFFPGGHLPKKIVYSGIQENPEHASSEADSRLFQKRELDNRTLE